MRCTSPLDLAKVIQSLGVKAADIEGDFYTRLRIQKAVYLLQMAGLGRFRCNFNMYFRGPYSSELADDYMALAQLGDDAIAALAAKSELEVPPYVAEADPATLEAAATLHQIMRHHEARYGAADIQDAVDLLLSIKPWAEKHLEEAIDILRHLKLLNG